MEKGFKNLIVIIIILTLIAINLGIFISYYKRLNEKQQNVSNPEEISENTETIYVDENKLIENVVDSKISNMDEGNRVKAYYGKFIDYIENKNYDKAYNCLNNEFRANYFQTLEEFTEYMTNKYPKNRIAVKYNSVERRGEIFVLSVTINDARDSSFKEFSESVVIRENSANNFSISFSKDYKDASERSK